MDAELLTKLGVILSLTVGLGSLIWQVIRERRQLLPQNRKTDSEGTAAQGGAAKAFAEAAQMTAEQNTEIMRQNIEITRQNAILTQRMGTAELRITALEEKDKVSQQLICDLQDWVKRLCKQVVDLGGIPAEIRRREMI